MNRIRLIFIVLVCACTAQVVQAQTALTKADLSVKSLIAPQYFSPNAFPVPDVLDLTQSELTLEVAADGAFGKAGDRTATLQGKLYLPLFTDRVNLTLWMPLQEWYEYTDKRLQECRLPESTPKTGHLAGDVFVSTDILVLRERKYSPNFLLRACVRTASGGGYHQARYYDSPGYFFDGAVSKTFSLTDGVDLRLAVSAGFLCWQTDNGRQNDAVMYGAKLSLNYTYLHFMAEYAGYSGWEKAGDRPMVVRCELRGDAPVGTKRNLTMHFMPFVRYEYGIRDFPYQIARIGLAYSFLVLEINNKQNR